MSIEEKQNSPTFQDSNSIEYPQNEKEVSNFIKRYYKANTPIESIEANYPLQINRYGFIQNTEGAGEYRGGMGIVREFQLLHEEATLQIRSDRSKFLPWGNQGGHPGTRNFNILNPLFSP